MNEFLEEFTESLIFEKKKNIVENLEYLIQDFKNRGGISVTVLNDIIEYAKDEMNYIKSGKLLEEELDILEKYIAYRKQN